MDITQLAHTVLITLLPVLPYVGKLGDEVAKGAAKKAGEHVFETGLTLWDKLHPRLRDKPAALAAAQEVMQAPEDTTNQEILRLQLQKLLKENPNFAQEVADFFQEQKIEGETTSIQQHAGDNATQIGRIQQMHDLNIHKSQP